MNIQLTGWAMLNKICGSEYTRGRAASGDGSGEPRPSVTCSQEWTWKRRRIRQCGESCHILHDVKPRIPKRGQPLPCDSPYQQ